MNEKLQEVETVFLQLMDSVPSWDDREKIESLANIARSALHRVETLERENHERRIQTATQTPSSGMVCRIQEQARQEIESGESSGETETGNPPSRRPVICTLGQR